MDLGQKVVQVKRVLAKLGFEALRLFLVDGLLGALHERHHIAFAEDTVGHPLRVEDVQRVHLFTGATNLMGLPTTE